MKSRSAREDEIIELGNKLFGLLSRAGAPSDRPCVVLLNAGFLPRSGPFRLHVLLARKLAAQGYPVLRFDLPGIGDSVELTDLPQPRILSDVFDALGQRAGYRRFVIGGICSAADLAWESAMADPRIVGVILIDGMARRTFSYMLGLLRNALRKPLSSWLSTLRGIANYVSRDRNANALSSLRDWPAAGTERSQLQTLIERKVELFFLYTGGTNYFLHHDQFAETFGSAAHTDTVRFQYWPRCDHIFYDDVDRTKLVASIGDWLEQRLPD